MSYIFIRHAEKAYANNKGPRGSPRLDPPIVDLERNKNLVGINPSQIITSPMIRCRQTAELNFPDRKYQTNVLLTEYLGNQLEGFFGLKMEPLKGDFEETTYELHQGFVFEDNTSDLYKRLIQARRSLPIPKEGEIIVIITHGLCLEYLSNIFKREVQENPSLQFKFFGKGPKNGFLISLK